jgi:hypothetical protein
MALETVFIWGPSETGALQFPDRMGACGFMGVVECAFNFEKMPCAMQKAQPVGLSFLKSG